MKKILRVFLLLMAIVAPATMSAQTYLHLDLADGHKYDCKLADSPVIKFADSRLVITVSESATEFEIANVKKFYFNESPTGISQAAAAALQFDYADGRVLRVSGTDAAAVQLYDVAGRVVATQTVENGAAAVSVQTLPAGVYVLKVGTQSVKITKK